MAVVVTHAKVTPIADDLTDSPDVVSSVDWNDNHTVTGLGTAAEAATTDFATAAQGALADTALQAAAIANMLETADIGVTVQAYDADLTALAALAGTNTIYYRSAADTWSAVSIGSGLSFAGGSLSASGGSGLTRGLVEAARVGAAML